MVFAALRKYHFLQREGNLTAKIVSVLQQLQEKEKTLRKTRKARVFPATNPALLYIIKGRTQRRDTGRIP